MARVEVVLKELVQGHLLRCIEWVHLACGRLETWGEFDGMVPWAALWQLVEFFLTEDIREFSHVVWCIPSAGSTQ